jgi:hypothetical protein
MNNRISGVVLSEFQTNVINQHPAFVFLETGASDIAWTSDSTPYGLAWEGAADNIIGIVKMAQAAGIKVILGNIVIAGFESDHFNGWLQAYAQAENIPIVNFQSLLIAGPNRPYCTPCASLSTLVEPTNSPFPMLLPTDAGSQIMTQMAQTAIATYGQTIKGGYLSDVQVIDGLNDEAPPLQQNVNQAAIGAGVQFMPQATWSDGVTRQMTNIPYGGVFGTWISSNPKVMTVNQQGFAVAYTPGTATIRFTTTSGHTFSPWTMTVFAPFPGPPEVPVPTY